MPVKSAVVTVAIFTHCIAKNKEIALKYGANVVGNHPHQIFYNIHILYLIGISSAKNAVFSFRDHTGKFAKIRYRH